MLLHNNNGSSSEDEEEDDFKVAIVTAYSVVPLPVVRQYQRKRVILLLDVDCYEVQLWMRKRKPTLIGKDIPVIVKNLDGVTLSVNYTAKALGVKRGKGLEDARSVCNRAGTHLVEITAGKRYGKVDSFLPLTESYRILDSIRSWSNIKGRALYFSTPITIERASKDEFYIDVTDLIDEKIKNYKKSRGENSICIPHQLQIDKLTRPKTHPNDEYKGKPTTCMEGRHRQITSQELTLQRVYPGSTEANHLDELRLVHGAIIANSIIRHIEKETEYQLSAGVGHSKLISKLASGLNKPKGICIITDVALPRLSQIFPFQDLPGFRRKIGKDVQNLVSSKLGTQVTYINDLVRATQDDGIDLEVLFQELGYSDSVAKACAWDLDNKCHFRDETAVTSKVHSDTINTVLSFEGFNGKQAFYRGLWNIARDMKSRINYYKRVIRRGAQELVVKGDYGSDDHNAPSCRQVNDNVFALPIGVNNFVEPTFICTSFKRYMRTNKLRLSQIRKIYLTAKNFSEDLANLARQDFNDE